jgi:integrase
MLDSSSPPPQGLGPGFHDFDEYKGLVTAAKSTDARAHLVVLLGGEAGLRCGEMMALEWTDVDPSKRQLCVQRSDWKGQVTAPKSGRLRYVPLTIRLAEALRDHRHVRRACVLSAKDGRAMPRYAKGVVVEDRDVFLDDRFRLQPVQAIPARAGRQPTFSASCTLLTRALNCSSRRMR